MYSKEAVEYYYSHAPKDEWYGSVQYLESIDEFYGGMSYEELREADRHIEALWESQGYSDVPF